MVENDTDTEEHRHWGTRELIQALVDETHEICCV